MYSRGFNSRFSSIAVVFLPCFLSLFLNSPTLAASPDKAPSRIIGKIIQGTPVSPKNSPVIKVRLRSQAGRGLCTGSLITTNVVLTAWHCVSGRPEDSTVEFNGREIAVNKVITHPGLQLDDAKGVIFNDLALLFLKSRVRATTLPIVRSVKVKKGNEVVIAGFGRDQNGITGFLNVGTILIDEVTPNHVVTFFEDGKGESNSCNGDSGGPALLRVRSSSGGSTLGVVGVVSTGSTTQCNFGDRTYYVNVQGSASLNFLKRYVRGVRYI
jgi:secreted trypsin-like serine protease